MAHPYPYGNQGWGEYPPPPPPPPPSSHPPIHAPTNAGPPSSYPHSGTDRPVKNSRRLGGGGKAQNESIETRAARAAEAAVRRLLSDRAWLAQHSVVVLKPSPEEQLSLQLSMEAALRSDVQRENEILKRKLEEMEKENEQRRENSREQSTF